MNESCFALWHVVGEPIKAGLGRFFLANEMPRNKVNKHIPGCNYTIQTYIVIEGKLQCAE